MAFYLDGNDIGDSTKIFTDEDMTINAPNGYYSNGDIVRQYVDGVLFPVSRCPSVIPTGETINLNYSEPTAAKLVFKTNPGEGCIAMDITTPLEPFSPLISFEDKYILLFRPNFTGLSIHYTKSNGQYFPQCDVIKKNTFIEQFGFSESSDLYGSFLQSRMFLLCGYENHDLVQNEFNLPGGHEDYIDFLEENNVVLPSSQTGIERLSPIYLASDLPDFDLSYAYWAGNQIEYTGTTVNLDYHDWGTGDASQVFILYNCFHNSPHPFTTRVPIPKKNIEGGLLEFYIYGFAATQSGFSVKIHEPKRLNSFAVNKNSNQTEEEAANSTLNEDSSQTLLVYYMPTTGDMNASNFQEDDFLYRDEYGTDGVSRDTANILGWHKDFTPGSNKIFRIDGHPGSFCKITNVKTI